MKKVCVLSWLVFAGVCLGEIPPGFEVVDVVRHSERKGHPAINDCGAVVFEQVRSGEYAGAEVFWYDNGLLKRISFSDGAWGALADIDSAGNIVWAKWPSDPVHNEIHMLERGGETILGPGTGPAINNVGLVVWKEFTLEACTAANLLFYDGDEVIRLVDNEHSNQSAEINDFGEIAWTEYHFCDSPWTSDIMLYSNGDFITLTTDQTQSQAPSINNHTDVTWGTIYSLEIWRDGENERFEGRYATPSINDHGDIAMLEKETTREIYLYQVSQGDPMWYHITEETAGGVTPKMNNWGEIVWRETGAQPTAIRLMRRIRTGDSEFDGDIDVDDLAKLVDCMTGPMWVERTNPGPEDSLCECRFLDINHDGSVDLRDYAIFQQNFGEQP